MADRAFVEMAKENSIGPSELRAEFQPDMCCSFCGGRDHGYDDCPKRRSDHLDEQPHKPGGAEKRNAA